MLIEIYRALYFLTFFVTIIFFQKAKFNKRLSELKSTSIIIQTGTIFDILIFFLKHENSVWSLLLFYYFLFPLCVLFSKKLTLINNYILITIILISSLLFSFNIEYRILKIHINSILLISIVLQLSTIIVSIIRIIKFNKKHEAANFFNFILIGFIFLDLLYFLDFYDVIIFEFSIWEYFLNYFLFYLIILRLSYLFYVFKNF